MILVVNGPNLNLLGRREPELYGRATLADLEAACRQAGARHGVDVECRQSNHEGQLIDWLQSAPSDGAVAVVLNPGGFAHTSVALRDTLAALELPVVEVHLTNVHGRERFRHRSLTAGVCAGIVAGFGIEGYGLAIDFLARRADGPG